MEYYKDNLRGLINREQEDDKEIFTKLNTRTYKVFKRNGFTLSNKILNVYANIANNNNEKFFNLFNIIKCIKYQDSNSINNNNNIINESQLKLNEDVETKNILGELILLNKKPKLEKELTIFGSYEFVEITDVIERHFILERCFSSYGLVKFALLNILAITRGFPNQKISNVKVMETICDFCNKTKSLARKYMNIFLNVFQELNYKNVIKNKKELLKCRNIIAEYFTKSNMLPTEETTKAFNEKQKKEEKKNVEEENMNVDISIDINKEEEQYINDNGKFFDEKTKKKKLDEIMKTIEGIFTGIYSNKTAIYHITYKELTNVYSKKGVKEKDKFLPKTPLNLYYSSKELLQRYMRNKFQNGKEDYDEILFDILSLLFYFKIPTIGEKWVERYRTQKETISNLKEPVTTIIAILINLIEVIQQYAKNI